MYKIGVNNHLIQMLGKVHELILIVSQSLGTHENEGKVNPKHGIYY